MSLSRVWEDSKRLPGCHGKPAGGYQVASGRFLGSFRRLLGGSGRLYEASRWLPGAKVVYSLVFIEVLGLPRDSQTPPGAEATCQVGG